MALGRDPPVWIAVGLGLGRYLVVAENRADVLIGNPPDPSGQPAPAGSGFVPVSTSHVPFTVGGYSWLAG
jgi:hypothetical protein